MKATRVLTIAALTVLGAACTQQDLSSQPITPSAPTTPTAAATVPAPDPAEAVVVPATTPPVTAPIETAPAETTAPEPAPATTAPVEDDTDTTPPDTTPLVEVEPPAADEPEPEPEPDPAPLPGPTDLVLDVEWEPPAPPRLPSDLIIAIPLAPCGLAMPIPEDATAVESMVIDVDNDGAADAVTTYYDGDWHLRLEIAAGPTDDVIIDGVGGAGMARILGDAQVDWSVTDPLTHVSELIVQAGANSSGANLAVFGIDDDRCLFRFSDDHGDDLVLPVHSSINALSGVLCDHTAGSGFLVELSAFHDGGTTYDATSTQLVRVGTALVPGTSLGHVIDSDTQADWLGQFGDLTCGSTSLD